MDVFSVHYLGNGWVSIRSSNGTELTPAKRFNSLPDLENWAIGFTSSWQNASVRFYLDDFLKELSYV